MKSSPGLHHPVFPSSFFKELEQMTLVLSASYRHNKHITLCR